jgi:hypothetical protein
MNAKMKVCNCDNIKTAKFKTADLNKCDLNNKASTTNETRNAVDLA